MPLHEYLCHDCGHQFQDEQPRMEDQPCMCCGADEVYRQWGRCGVIVRGGTPTFGASRPADEGITKKVKDAPIVDVTGATNVDADGDSIWKPTDKVMRRQLRKMGSPTNQAMVDRAQDQIRKTERDANEAHQLLQDQKEGKRAQTRKDLEDKL